MTEPLEKRTWCYVQPPADYGMAPCACGNADTQWSEFKGRLWCAPCAIDFVPEHGGVFDGPIPVVTSALLGMSFDRINLETNEVERFDMDKMEYRVGEYVADYTPLTADEIAEPVPEIEELLSRSKPVEPKP